MYDIILYGNIVKDIIFDISDDVYINKNINLGGVINNWRHLIDISNNEIKIDIAPLSYGEAVIFIDKKKSERNSNGNLNINNYIPNIIQKCNWSHISYLNKININKKTIKGICNESRFISADITNDKGKLENYKYINNLDFLFMSEDESYIKEDFFIDKIKKYIIIHSPTGSKAISKDKVICVSQEELKENCINYINGVNVLGAGDCFASAFIYNIIKNDYKITDDIIKDSLIFSHKSVYEKLLKQKNKDTFKYKFVEISNL